MKTIKVQKNSTGIRIDKFLAQEFFSLSRADIIKNIKAGKILVNSKIIKPSYTLKENDLITTDISFTREEVISNSNIRFDKIYEDENILVINKPAGIQVHPDSNEKENTVANYLVANYPQISNVHDGSLGAFLRPGIVHRLDKDTSGILVIAKNLKTFRELKDLFQGRRIQKKYLAIVYGKLRDRRGIITKPIARAGNYRKQVIAGAKTKTKIRGAVTEYKVLKSSDKYSLLEVAPKTGRMHQIRIHLFSIGHPIVGDKIYKLKSKVQPWEEKRLNLKIGRHLLHASEIGFKLFGENFKFHAKPPQDFKEFITKLDYEE